jgi:hypothetical protein
LKSFWNSPFSSASSSLIEFPDPRDVGGTTDAFSLLCMLWMSSWFSEWFSHNSCKSENHTKMKSIWRLYLHYNCSQMIGLVSVWAKEFSSLFKFQSFSILPHMTRQVHNFFITRCKWTLVLCSAAYFTLFLGSNSRFHLFCSIDLFDYFSLWSTSIQFYNSDLDL